MIDIDRVSDVDLLRQVAKIQDAEIRRLHNKLTEAVQRLAEAKGADAEEIAEQLRMLQAELAERYAATYKTGSERRPKSDKPEKKKTPQKGHGPKAQHELPLDPVIHRLDEADQVCPDCGGRLGEWEGKFEDSEEVDVVEIQYVLKKHRRQKYKCCGCDHIETALGPEKLIPGGRYSLNFAVHTVMEKFADHLPLERQVKRMKRAGLWVDSQTLWDQQWALTVSLKDAVERLHTYLLSQEVVLADETHWPLLGAKGRKTKNCFVWALVGKGGVVYRIQDSRSKEAGRVLLRDFAGVVVADGYVVYESLAKESGFTVANDWCHVRRKLIDAEASSPEEATAFLDDIGELFLNEREIAGQIEGLDPIQARALRAQVRDERSRHVVQRIGDRAGTIRAFRDSPLARAVKYMENRWKGLILFLDDPRVPITSNDVERSLRSPVLGRNNHFGSRSKRGTESAALLYSLIETAKLNDVDPRRYLYEAATASLRGQTIPLPHEIA